MKLFFQHSLFFGVCLSLISYGIGAWLKSKYRSPLLNPLLIGIILTSSVLLLLEIDYSHYNGSAKYLSYLLTPATVALAVPLYEQFELLKKHAKAVLSGIAAGVLTGLGCVLFLSFLFGLDHTAYVTLLPKSITTAIGIGVSEELGGHVSLTVAVIIITGILGNVFAETACKLFHIGNPIAKGIAIGSASHAMGTAKAMEMGEIEGAMSSLSMILSGILTVLLAAPFAGLLP
jgi:predicted murein hydrolase (TIGR00659 family)